jgi:parallel beta-helix repeat protein
MLDHSLARTNIRRLWTATAVIAIAVALTAATARAADVTVCASGCDDTTIQAAIDASTTHDGDRIDVGAGNYPGSVTVTKRLWLAGVDAGLNISARTGPESVLTGSTDIDIQADGVRIDGFTIGDGTDTDHVKIHADHHSNLWIRSNVIRGGYRGVWLVDCAATLIERNSFVDNNDSADTGAHAGVWADDSTGIRVVQNAFSGNDSTAINTPGLTNSVIRENTSTNDATMAVLVGGNHVDISRNSGTGFTGSAIFLGLDNDGVWVTDNTLSQGGAPSTAGLRLSSAFGDGANLPMTNVHLIDNDISGFKYGLRAADDSGQAVGADVDAHLDAFHGNQFAISNEGTGNIDAEHDWFGCPLGAGTGCDPVTITGSGNVDHTNPLTAQFTGTTIIVNGSDPTPDDHGCGFPGNACDTVQHGVDNAPTDATVQIAAGTYVEQVDVWRTMSLQGSTTATTTIRSVAHGTQQATVTVAGAPQYPVLTVHNAYGATQIDSLTIDGSGPGADASCATNLDGIAIVDSGAVVITNSVVEHVREIPSSLGGCQVGRAIYGRDTEGSLQSITVERSTISDYQKNGIDLRGHGLSVDVQLNTITDTPDDAIATNGVVIGSGPEFVNVSSNTISGNECDLPSVCGSDPLADTQSTGILVFDNGPTIIGANTITQNDIGIATGEGGSPNTVIGDPTTSVGGNTVTDNRYEGLYLDAGETTVNDNTVSGGLIGVFVSSLQGDDLDSDVSIVGNQVGSPTGVEVLDAFTGDDFFPHVDISENSLSHSPHAIDNETHHLVEAPDNWYGCLDPNGNPGGAPGDPGCPTVVGPGADRVHATALDLFLNRDVSSIDTGGQTARFDALLLSQDGRSPGLLGVGAVTFATTLGTITPTADLFDSDATATLTSGSATGAAVVTATYDGLSSSSTIEIAAPMPPPTTTVTAPAPPPITTTVPVPSTTTVTTTSPVAGQGPPVGPATAAETAAQALAGAGSTRIASVNGAPVFGGSTVTSVANGSTTLFAIGCPKDTCVIAVKGQLRLFDRHNRLTTSAVATKRLTLEAGTARLVRLRLSSAQRSLVRRAHRATIKVVVSLTDPTTKKTSSVSKTFRLKLSH